MGIAFEIMQGNQRFLMKCVFTRYLQRKDEYESIRVWNAEN